MAKWHVGMMPSRANPSPTRLTVSNRLTLLRLLLPAAVLGNRAPPGKGVRVAAALAGVLTDVFDGYLARRTSSRTHFGTVADPLADAALWTALATTARGGRTTRVLAWLTALRFGTPIAIALAVTFGRGISFDWRPYRMNQWSSAVIGIMLTVREIRGTSGNRSPR
ncbi:MAG: CDP-alcohol phosphatidyltransferase family protein [Chloroflexota bacterium]